MKPRFALWCILLVGLMVLLPSISASLNDSLVSYYNLDETSGTTAYDSLGLYNMTNYGMNVNQGGILDKSYYTNNGFLNRTNPFPTITNFSISFWIKYSDEKNNIILDNGWFTTGNNILCSLNGTNSIGCGIRNGGAASEIFSPTANNDSNWHHVIFKNNASSVSLWIDGVQKAEKSSTSVTSAATNNLYISGKYNNASFKLQTTYLDEFGIWNRSLTTTEIMDLYNSGIGNSYPFFNISPYEVNLIYPPFGSLLTDIGSDFNVTYNISGTSDHEWKNATYNLYKNGAVFNQTTVSLSGNNTFSSLYIDNFVIGNYVWNVNACYGNATYNNCTLSENYTYTVGASFENVTYSSSIYETQSQTISGNLTLVPGTEVYDVKLVYNGTQHQGVYTDMGNNTYLLSSTFDTSVLPSTSSSNMSFYVRIIYSVGAGSFLYENTTSLNQTVNPISLYSCTSATNRTLNFTAKDEENLTDLNTWNFLGTFEYWLGSGNSRKNMSVNNLSINSSALCLSIENLTFKTDAIIQYEKSDYVKRNYYLYNASITNTTQNITLYLLSSASSTSFIVQVRDKSQLPVANAYLYSQRYYPGTANFETVAMGKTDLSGNTVLHFEDETEDYRIIVMKDGVILYTSAVQKVYCSATPCTLPIQTESGGIEGWNNFGNLTDLIYTGPYYDSTLQQVIYTYIDTSGTTSYGRLEVYNFVNGKKNVICDTNSTSNAATLTCDVSGIEGKIYAEAYLSRSPEVLVWAKQFIINTIKEIMGMEGLFWALIIILVLAIAGGLMGGVSGGVIGVILGMWGVELLQIATFGAITTWGVTAIGIFILWNSRN